MILQLIAFLAAAIAPLPEPNTKARAIDPVAQEIFAVGETATLIELDVDVRGKVTDCRILVSSRSEKLDQKACEILRGKAKFESWKGSDRSKVRKLRQRIVWKIEE